MELHIHVDLHADWPVYAYMYKFLDLHNVCTCRWKGHADVCLGVHLHVDIIYVEMYMYVDAHLDLYV